MNICKTFRDANPSLLVLFFVPVLFLAIPDNLPFVYAGCASLTAGEATDPTISCQSCFGDTSGNKMVVNDCSIDNSTSFCEITVSGELDIQGNQDMGECTTHWLKDCTVTCAPDTDGPGNGLGKESFTYTHGCDADGDLIRLRMRASNCDSCDDPSEILLDAQADCDTTP